jgi:hypothetical protein
MLSIVILLLLLRSVQGVVVLPKTTNIEHIQRYNPSAKRKISKIFETFLRYLMIVITIAYRIDI